MTATALLFDLGDLRHKWGWFLALGIIMIVFGMIALAVMPAATIGTVLILGWLMIFSGIVETIHGFQVRSWGGFFLHLLGGIVGVLIGLLVVTHPVAGALAWTLLFASFFTVIGLFRLIAATRLKFPNWGWAAFDGAGARLLRILLCSFAVAQNLSPEVKEFVKVDAPIVVLQHIRVIDGTGSPAREDQTIVLASRKIESVANAASASVPHDAQVLDLHGYSVLPGLVGMHDHMFYPMGNVIFGEMAFSFPRLYLAGGVTTIRTTGSREPYRDLEMKRAIDSGAMPGPHIQVTGPYLEGKGSWALQLHQLTGPEDATTTVNYWLDEGVDNFKIYNFITADELSAAIAAAHKRGAKVTGHLCSIGFREAAALGIDDLEHGLLVDTEFFPWKNPGQCPDNPKHQ